ncbi:uncharacterized protein LOC119389057 [Rhipicephalus sanguineus]|uniref:uncharacterized protein LOC119389057 n=1 Tax=Rhipicephalus sanguineus TaxID=34632 RepID=UPI0018943F2C|nr:uncharacterized protein LOC119389057 [Rhipicephalus sanguineus]
MRMLRIELLLIAFLTYNVHPLQANSAYRYVINSGALSGNGIEDELMAPSSEDSLQRQIPFVNGKDIAEEYDARNLKEGEEGDSYSFRVRERRQYGSAEGGPFVGVSVFFVMPRRELEEYRMSWREQQEIEARAIKRYLGNLFRKAGQGRSGVASHSATTSEHLGSGDEFGEDYVRQGGDEPRRREDEDVQGTRLSQLLRKAARQHGFADFYVTGAQEDKSGLLRIILGLLRRRGGHTHRMKGFSEVRSIPGRLPEYTRDYLGHVFSLRANGGGRSDADIEIIRDGSRLGNLHNLFEGSPDEEQLMPSRLNLRSGDIGDVSDSRSSIARLLSLLERPRRYYEPRSHRSPILYRYRSFPHKSSIQQRGRTVDSAISRYWRYEPRLFVREELLYDMGKLRDGNVYGIYGKEFRLPTTQLGRARWKFYVYEGQPGGTNNGGIIAYSRGYDRNRYSIGNRASVRNRLLRDSFHDESSLNES